MISDLNGSPGSLQCFASRACAFKSSGLVLVPTKRKATSGDDNRLVTRLECTSDLKVTFVFFAFE